MAKYGAYFSYNIQIFSPEISEHYQMSLYWSLDYFLRNQGTSLWDKLKQGIGVPRSTRR